MNAEALRSKQAIELADHVSNPMFHRFRREFPLGDVKSLAQAAAITAAAAWDGRGSFPKYAIQRMRWAIIDGIRREMRHHQRPMDASSVQRMAAQNAERAADITSEMGMSQASTDPPNAADSLAHFLRDAAVSFTVELDAAGVLAIPDAEEDVEGNVERMRIRRAISQLPTAERTIIERYHYGGETFDEIAAASGTHRSTVFSCYVRAQEKLRRVFEETA